MKKTLLMLIAFIFYSKLLIAQSVGINNDTPDASAILDVTSTTKGMLAPRMTTVQRNAIASPARGLTVYDTNTNSFWYYNGTTWTQLSSGSATNYWTASGTNIFNNNSGYVGIGTNAPDYKLSIFNSTVESNNNTSLLKLSGRNPVVAFTDENATGFGYLKAWTNGAASGGFNNGMLIGAFPGYPIYLSTNYGPAMTVAANNLVGIGTTAPTSPLSFNNILGNKISFWNAGPNNDFGIGIATGTMQFYTAGTDKFAFGWGNSNAFTETMSYYPGSGQLALGTTTPQAKLHVAQDNEAIRITGSQSFLSFFNGTTPAAYVGYLWNKGGWDMELGTASGNNIGNLYLSMRGTPALTIKTTGHIVANSFDDGISVHDIYNGGIGGGVDTWSIYAWTAEGSLTFDKNGTHKAFIEDDGSYTQSSDMRLKEDLVSYKSVLKDLQKLNVLTYYYKDSNKSRRSFGLIAQNVETYFPEIVWENMVKNGDKFLSLDYSKTGVLAIKAIQEQQVIIEQQQQKINDLEKRLDALEKMINRQ